MSVVQKVSDLRNHLEMIKVFKSKGKIIIKTGANSLATEATAAAGISCSIHGLTS